MTDDLTDIKNTDFINQNSEKTVYPTCHFLIKNYNKKLPWMGVLSRSCLLSQQILLMMLKKH